MARYADPAWEIGMALGNAYGNMWAANAKKRQEEKAERLISDMMGGNVTGEDVNAAITSGTGMLEHQNRADGVTAQDVQAAIRGWPVGLTADDMRNNLRKNKINQEVIDKVMPGYEKQMREAMTAKFLPQIMGSLYGENSDYGNAMQQVIALSKYDPDTAKLLMGGIPTGRDVYKQKGAETLKGLGSLNGIKKGNQLNASMFSALASEIERLKTKDSVGGGLTDEEQIYLADLERSAAAMARQVGKELGVEGLGTLPATDATSTTNNATEKGWLDGAVDWWSNLFGGSDNKTAVSANYAKAENEWQTALARNQNAGADVRWTKEQMIDYARKKYGADADAIINATDWKAFGF